jgi:hypothetical protein
VRHSLITPCNCTFDLVRVDALAKKPRAEPSMEMEQGLGRLVPIVCLRWDRTAARSSVFVGRGSEQIVLENVNSFRLVGKMSNHRPSSARFQSSRAKHTVVEDEHSIH